MICFYHLSRLDCNLLHLGLPKVKTKKYLFKNDSYILRISKKVSVIIIGSIC